MYDDIREESDQRYNTSIVYFTYVLLCGMGAVVGERSFVVSVHQNKNRHRTMQTTNNLMLL